MKGDPKQDPEQELLAAMRRMMTPTQADQDNVAARLFTQLAAGAFGLPEADSPSEPVGQTPAQTPGPTPTTSAHASTWMLSAGLRGLGSQVVGAAFVASVAFGGGYLVGRSASPIRTDASGFTPGPPPAAPVSRPSTSVTDQGGAPSVSRQVPLPAPKAQALQPGSSDHMLSEEARELRRVDGALRSGMPELAVRLLDDLDARIPKGGLGEERAAARLMARCMRHDPDATSAATRWLRSHPRSVYTSRLHESCLSAGDPDGNAVGGNAVGGNDSRGQ